MNMNTQNYYSLINNLIRKTCCRKQRSNKAKYKVKVQEQE